MNYKKLVIVFTVIVVAVIGLFVLLSFNSVTASERTHPPEVAAPGESDIESADSSLSPQEQLAILSQRAVALTSQPGWVFVRLITISDTDHPNNGILPDGNIIPSSNVVESWYHVNEDGLVYEDVGTMFTLDGEVVQTGVFAGSSSWNSATDEKSYMAPYFLGEMSDLASRAQEMIDRTGQMPDMVVTETDGKKIYTFTVHYKPDEPIYGSDFDQAVTEIITIVSLDDDTGLPIQYDQIMVLEDGTERAFYRTSIEIQIGATPPEGVVNLIEERK